MLYKQPSSKYWYVKLKHRGRLIRKSTGETSKRRAEAVQKQLRQQLQALRKRSAHTFEDAAIRWIEEKQHKRSLETDAMIIRWFRPHLAHLFLSEITRAKVEDLRQLLLAGHSKSTVNRYFALLRSILKICRDDWEWVDKIPKIPMWPKKTRAPRFLTLEQFSLLETELPSHLSAPAWFSVSTGLRTTAIQKLQWNWISRDGVRFPPEVMKNAQWLTIPLSLTAWHVIAECYSESDSTTLVFVNHVGKPWAGAFTKAAWRKAIKRAGLEGVTFHDLRHTWASWHAQKGTPMDIIQKLGGWSTYEAMQIYAHHSPASLQEWV